MGISFFCLQFHFNIRAAGVDETWLKHLLENTRVKPTMARRHPDLIIYNRIFKAVGMLPMSLHEMDFSTALNNPVPSSNEEFFARILESVQEQISAQVFLSNIFHFIFLQLF